MVRTLDFMNVRLPYLPVPPPGDKGTVELQAFAAQVVKQNTQNLLVMDGYMRRSYHTVFAMYVALFVVGLGTAIAAIIKGFVATGAANAVPALVFAGLSVGSFFTLFLTRPLESLERNSIFSAWLIAITNTYWTRLAYFADPGKIDDELRAATADLVRDLGTLADKAATAYGKYPALTAMGGGTASTSGTAGGTMNQATPASTQTTTRPTGNTGGMNAPHA